MNWARFAKLGDLPRLDGKPKKHLTRVVKVYALVDPRDGTVRYIGVTRTALAVRLERHLAAPTNARTRAWFLSLATAGVRPAIRLLGEVREDRWPQNEMFLVVWLREHGFSLLNVDPGGVHRDPRGRVRGRNRLSADALAKRVREGLDCPPHNLREGRIAAGVRNWIRRHGR